MCCAMLHWGNIFVVLQHISKMLRKVLEGVINVNQKLSTEKANVFNPELEGNGAKLANASHVEYIALFLSNTA